MTEDGDSCLHREEIFYWRPNYILSSSIIAVIYSNLILMVTPLSGRTAKLMTALLVINTSFYGSTYAGYQPGSHQEFCSLMHTGRHTGGTALLYHNVTAYRNSLDAYFSHEILIYSIIGANLMRFTCGRFLTSNCIPCLPVRNVWIKLRRENRF
jgi:hypothetical protein